jgi:DNA-binding transcriptional ArsR family regulator
MASEVSISDQLKGSVKEQNNAPSVTGGVGGADVLSRYIEERKHDYCAWQLIQFFAEHPYVRFNRLAVIHALNLDSGRRYIQKALDELIEQGIIKASPEGSSVLYSLAEDMRRLVLKLTRPARNE